MLESQLVLGEVAVLARSSVGLHLLLRTLPFTPLYLRSGIAVLRLIWQQFWADVDRSTEDKKFDCFVRRRQDLLTKLPLAACSSFLELRTTY